MTPAEATVLLAGIAAFDNRKPDEQAAKMWAHALSGLRLEDCALAVTEHFATSTEYLMPAHLRTIVKRIRSKRIAEAGDLLPPPDLGELETRQWLREARRRIGNGETREQVEVPRELKPRDMSMLRALPAPDGGAPPADHRQAGVARLRATITPLED